MFFWKLHSKRWHNSGLGVYARMPAHHRISPCYYIKRPTDFSRFTSTARSNFLFCRFINARNPTNVIKFFYSRSPPSNPWIQTLHGAAMTTTTSQTFGFSEPCTRIGLRSTLDTDDFGARERRITSQHRSKMLDFLDLYTVIFFDTSTYIIIR